MGSVNLEETVSQADVGIASGKDYRGIPGFGNAEGCKPMKIPRTGHWPSDRVGKAIEDVCYWQWDVDGFWRGSCGIPWWMETGTPKENGMNFCPRCGKRLKQKGGAR